MDKLMCFFGGAALLALGILPVQPFDATGGDHDLEALSWLAGEWRGKAGDTEVVSWHSDPAGGMILMASKELEGEKLTLFDFGVVTRKQGEIVYVPYPHGKSSVAFTLVDFDPKVERAVFQNEAHDFPKRFVFERFGQERLRIVLTGDEVGKPTTQEYDLGRASSAVPAKGSDLKK